MCVHILLFCLCVFPCVGCMCFLVLAVCVTLCLPHDVAVSSFMICVCVVCKFDV